MRITAIIASVTFVSGLVTGWLVNGWRLEARIASLQASHAQAYAEAQKAARDKEQALIKQSEEIRRTKDAQIKIINNRLASALNSLRERPTRPDKLPETAASGAGCTANQLYREDSESFIWIARDADLVRASLQACIGAYDSARKALE